MVLVFDSHEAFHLLEAGCNISRPVLSFEAIYALSSEFSTADDERLRACMR